MSGHKEVKEKDVGGKGSWALVGPHLPKTKLLE